MIENIRIFASDGSPPTAVFFNNDEEKVLIEDNLSYADDRGIEIEELLVWSEEVESVVTAIKMREWFDLDR